MPDVNIQTTISPFTQEPVCTRPLLSSTQLDAVVAQAVKAQKGWRKVPLEERVAIAERWMAEFEKNTDLLAEDIALQMGRPVGQCKGEINGTLYRARHLVKIAKEALAPIPQTETDDEANKRYIIRQPLGVVVAITPWNFPHLTAVNSVLPALLAGNAVIIKPAPQTPVPAERVLECFNTAGLPTNVLQVIHLSQQATLDLCADGRVNFVSFTGSVPGGRAVQEAAAHGKGFKGVGLELGGKDPAYVREDADLKYTVANLVDGAFFNSGQSCCSVERIYVHSAVHDEFVAQFAELTRKDYVLGDPMAEGTTLGPVVSLASAKRIRKQVADAVAAGATLLVGEAEFAGAKEGTTLVGPQVLTNVDHSMEVMTEETFGPVAAIMKVESDEEALALMNDSKYGLTASVWTNPDDAASIAVFNNFVEELEAGTVYLNRADALDPAVPWTGVKDTGRGYSLSVLGYGQLTQAKSVMMRVKLN
ncbi:aldehyde dehydrogenase [Cutaneotrichosporon oleaginosum]|uniref:Aldehyde dehydrogenase n=1 Tax=Cutaneotrichosporon oleaginosum TaxID=879819 RepID=A0A0J0XFZ8_9TREE|nr:aldehyde dehydrogenase [Cutaneotrichosporon oleaginosum]KLT39977.1 aldehyde dehydrogenase [Cutaneotrichosporon oleaginosum]TXT14166.1 hypothetical protein COLE_00359 [Cutaneotrichosporon oleaginosum]